MLHTRHRERLLLQTCLEMGQSFVVDNTNPTVDERARYIEPARAGGFRVVGYYFRSVLAESIVRNAERTGRAWVPPQGIGGTARRLQLPTLTEGFDQLFYVRLNSVGQFIVEDWQDAV